MVQRWLYSTNAKDIAVLYFMLAIFSGMAGTAMSLIIRLELAAPGSQYLHGNSQLFNVLVVGHAVLMIFCAPFRLIYHCIEVLIDKHISVYSINENFTVSFWFWLLVVTYIVFRYVNHMAYPVGANSTGTIACHKSAGVKQPAQGKNCPMARLTNSCKECLGFSLTPSHLGIVIHAYVLEEEVHELTKNESLALSKSWHLEGCTSSNGKLRNTGLSERGNPGDNGVFIVPKFNLNKVRYFSTLSKLNARKEDSLAYLTKINTTDFSELNKLIENNHNKLETINTRILKLMSDIRMLLIAYNKIKSKKGNISKGSNNITLDGINISYLNKLSKDINTNMFKFSPVRRVEIPKTSGGFRPLSVGNPREKIVQESMRIILEIIYNNSFSYYSHGFRPNLSCLTAIIQCKNYMQYCNWFIKVDLNKCFDTIPHNMLINVLNERIKDKGFIDLLYKLLRAGYVDKNNNYHNTTLGIPQGSVVSPILCNIFLDKLDKYLENKFENEFNTGNMSNRGRNPIYNSLSSKIYRCKLLSEKLKLIRLRDHYQRNMGSDKSFKRAYFVRYADDIIIGVMGSHNDCKNILNDINNFLKENLGMSINIDKSVIKHSKEGVSFLGYDVKVTPWEKRPYRMIKKGDNFIRVRHHTSLVVNAPIRSIVIKLNKHGYCSHGILGKPRGVGRLIHEEMKTILMHYLAVGRGIINYYRLATNFTTLRGRITYILFYSCCLTLARKFKLNTVKKVILKFGKVLVDPHSKVSFSIDDFKIRHKINITDSNYTPDEILDRYKYMLPRSLSLFSGICQICGSKHDLEVHHVRTLNNAANKIKDDYLLGRMIKINRKQITICKTCHFKVHQGKYNGPGL